MLPERFYMRVVVDYLHDLAFGVFPGTVLAAGLIWRAAERVGTGQAAVSAAAGTLWLVMLLGVTVSVLTGLVRLRYWKTNVRSGFLETKSQMAAIKHWLFVMTVVGSAAALYTIVS